MARYGGKLLRVLHHQFSWEKSGSEVFLTLMYIELKFKAISEYDKWWWSYTQRRV
jgi:hypothetical protein